MKMLNPMGGTAALQVVADEILPPPSFLQRELVDFVAGRYNLYGRPIFPPNTSAMPILQFQSGFLKTEDKRIIIQQLIVFPDGIAVVAHDTDAASVVLDDALIVFNEEFDYRFGQAPEERLYSSALVVELEDAFVHRASVFEIIRRAAIEACPVSDQVFDLKSFVFGTDPSPPAAALAVSPFDNSRQVISLLSVARERPLNVISSSALRLCGLKTISSIWNG